MSNSTKWKLAQTLEIKWWQNYLRDKDVEKYLSWKKDYWKNFIQKIPNLPPLQQYQILDAGCGPAGIFTVLENNIVDAIDPLLDKYSTLPHFNSEQYKYTNFKNISIEALEVENKYDFIFCLNAINHVADIQLAYKKLANALKKDGIIYISVDAHRNNFLKKIFQFIPGDVLHPHQYNLKEYEYFLVQQGLQILPSIHIKKEPIFDYYLCIAQK